MRLLGRTKKDVDKDKDRENVRKLESVEVVSVHCNLSKHDYQHTSSDLLTVVPNKKFGQLINISPHSLTIWIQLILNFLLLKLVHRPSQESIWNWR